MLRASTRLFAGALIILTEVKSRWYFLHFVKLPECVVGESGGILRVPMPLQDELGLRVALVRRQGPMMVVPAAIEAVIPRKVTIPLFDFWILIAAV